MSEEGEATGGAAPLTRADIPELVKAVAEALAKKDDPPLPKDGAIPPSTSGGELLASWKKRARV